MSTIDQAKEGTPAALKAANTTKTLTPLPTQEEYNAELAQLELESRRLEAQFRALQLSDLQDQVNDRSAKKHDKGERARINGQTITQLNRNDKLVQGRCNHRKGGNGAMGVVAGQGDDNQYAVMKHVFSNGDMWVACLRCHKTWKPPIEEDFETKEGYIGAYTEYQAATQFQTRNVTSGSVAFKWGDNGKFYRQTMRHTTLR